MPYLVLKESDCEIELTFQKIPCKLSYQQHMLAGGMALMVDCLSLQQFSPQHRTKHSFWKTHPLFFNWVSVVELLQLQPGT